MSIPAPLPNSLIGGISLKTVIIVVVVIIVLYTGTTLISSSLSSSSSAGTISNKIVCQLGEVIVDGACVNPGPCGIKPTTSECDPSLLICDLNRWRCPLPCENSTHPLPNGLGKCIKSEIKCDSLGEYYCANDSTFCSSSGSYYSNGTTGRCICNPGYIGDTCEIKCPENYFVHQNQCMPILTCNNGGIFNMTSNMCSCTRNYTGATCDYTSTVTCSGNGTVVLNSSRSFDHCNCNAGYLGPHCNVSAAYCNNKGTPLFDINGNVTGCACDPGYGGKYCDLNGSDYCHGHGTPLSLGVDKNNRSIFDEIHGCINCNSSSSGKYCCPNPSPTNTDTCGIKGYVCNSYSSQNDGWTPDYYTATDFSNNQDFKNGKGPCVAKYCGNVDTTKYKVILEDKGTGSAGQTITCSTQCPYTLTNDMCPGGGTSSTGIYDGNNCKVSYEKGDTYSHMCICDQTTGYKPSCKAVQTDGNKKCGDIPTGLCGQGGPQPECLQCPNGGFMWYCPGEVPAKGTPLANNLMRCAEMSQGVVYDIDADFWKDRNGVPIYPAIDNDKCESGSYATSFVSFDTQDLYNIFGNTKSNYETKDGRFTKIADRDVINKSTQMLTNARRSGNGTIGYFSSIANAFIRQNVQDPGCIVNIPSGNPDVGYCNGNGKFKQTCYQSDGKTVVDCDDTSNLIYRLHDGTCTCGTYVSNTDGVTKKYLGDKCQYSDNKYCNSHGTVNANGVCSCTGGWTGNDCGYPPIPPGLPNGSVCTGNSQCRTWNCENGTCKDTNTNFCPAGSIDC